MGINIFFCYSTQNDTQNLIHNLVNELYDDLLTVENLHLWSFERNGKSGSDYVAEYLAAVRNCDYFILFGNSGAFQSEHVQIEIQTALQANKKIIPIIIEEAVIQLLNVYPIMQNQIPYFDPTSRDHFSLFHKILETMNIG